MAQKKTEFHEEASQEYLAAFIWYLERSEAVAARFARELARAIELIGSAPQRWPQYAPGIHKFVLRRFHLLFSTVNFLLQSKSWLWLMLTGGRATGKRETTRPKLRNSGLRSPAPQALHGKLPPTMRLTVHANLFSRATLFFLFVVVVSLTTAFAQDPAAQTQSSAPAKPKRHDSLEIVAHLSPEEVEEGKLSDAYQAIAQFQRKGDCSTTIIQRYQSEVIALAEKSAFNVPKNKFLFLANQDIGNCYLSQQKYVEAEASFQKIMQFLPVWPGTNDSDYPINFRQIATAQISQQHWTEAEQSLLKSIPLFDTQIAAAEKSDSKFMREEHSRNLRGSQSTSYALLAVVYFREERMQDALATVEKAYDEVTKYKLAPQFHNEVVKIGRAIADASEDSAAQRTWADRNPL